jgi:hypothetical protein
VLGPFSTLVSDAVTNDRTLVPILDLEQSRLQIVGDTFLTFAGVLNLYGLRRNRVSEVGFAAKGLN